MAVLRRAKTAQPATGGKQLLCPRCGDVVADVVYRPWRGVLRLTTPGGRPVLPIGGALLVRRLEAEAAAAEGADRVEALRLLEFTRDHLGEVLYELRCHYGHRSVRTAPQLARATRKATGRWVSL